MNAIESTPVNDVDLHLPERDRLDNILRALVAAEGRQDNSSFGEETTQLSPPPPPPWEMNW